MKEDNPIIDIADAATTNVEAPAADKAKPVDEKADETRQQAIEDELPLSKNLTLK